MDTFWIQNQVSHSPPSIAIFPLPLLLRPRHFYLHSHFSSPFLVLETQNLEPSRTKITIAIHNSQQQPKSAAFALPLAALPSHYMGMSAAPPTHGAAAPYGPTQGARDAPRLPMASRNVPVIGFGRAMVGSLVGGVK